MNLERLFLLATFLLVIGVGAEAQPTEQTSPPIVTGSANEYERDVEAAIEMAQRDYPGYEDKLKRFGAEAIDGAARHARDAAARAKTMEDCSRILADWVGVFKDEHMSALFFSKDGHLGRCDRIHSESERQSKSAWSSDPTTRILSDDTFLITVPSFDGYSTRLKIVALTKRYDAEIKRRSNLIIDLRGNGGGSDSAYHTLSPYLYTQPFMEVGCDMLATKDLADASDALMAPIPEQAPAGWKKILEDRRIPEQDKQDREVFAALVKQMRAAPEGTFFSSCPDGTETLPEVLPLPARVAILIDGRCASTTEQFLLEARQSKKVILFGQPSGGCLDYANLCYLMLPSGKFFLTMPMSRSRRLPKNPVDNIGIAPDVLIPNLTRPQTSGDTAVNFVRDYLKQHPLPNKPQPANTPGIKDSGAIPDGK